MKKASVIIIIFILIVGVAVMLPSEETNYDYLRLHIRANSNLSVDQSVKYEIKAKIVEYLAPYLSEVESKEDAIKTATLLKNSIENICNQLLSQKGFSYRAVVSISNEYFPTRTYSNTTLESGYYDAVIVNLGNADGDNWWCVMYPPLCFVNKFEMTTQNIKYKSKILEWVKRIFN